MTGKPVISLTRARVTSIIYFSVTTCHRGDVGRLDLRAKYDGQGRKMSHKVAANDYAPRVLSTVKGSQVRGRQRRRR
jgi:hypothetical protein